MYLYFNKNGQLLEKLEHGSAARAGSTDFEIFAFFEDLNIESAYTLATLKLIKPDLAGNSHYEITQSERKTIVFNRLDNESNRFFKDGVEYKGYYFDFTTFDEEQEETVLLDTEGNWQFNITLYKYDRSTYVQGRTNIYVQPGIEVLDGTELNIEQLIRMLNMAIAGRIPLDSKVYFRVMDDDIPSEPFNVGDVVFSKASKNFYQIINSDGELEPIELELEDVIINGLLNLDSAEQILFSDGKTLKEKLDGKANLFGGNAFDGGRNIFKSPTEFKNDIYVENGRTIYASTLNNSDEDHTKDIAIPQRGGTLALAADVEAKQDKLIDSGDNKNFKTINGESLLGEGGGNIVVGDAYSVRYDVQQSLTDTQKTQARTNIDAQKTITSDNKLSKDLVSGLPGVINNLTSDSTTDSLSAKQGKTLKGITDDLSERIDNISAKGRFLAMWNAEDGSVNPEPPGDEYVYNNGDYFIVDKVGYRVPKPATKYISGGTNYIIQSEQVAVGDQFFFENSNNTPKWIHQKAGRDFAGVSDVKIDGYSIKSSSDNIAYLYTAPLSTLIDKLGNNEIVNAVNIDNAVKAGLSYSEVTYTDTEKTNARALIGAGTSDAPEIDILVSELL